MKRPVLHLFVARRKDNEDVVHFHPRKKSFLAYEGENFNSAFEAFVNEGQPGEYSRHYVSVNPRDEGKIRDELVIRILRAKPSVTKISAVTASIAAKPECAAEHKWLLDFDSRDKALLEEFMKDLRKYFSDDEEIRVYDTPNGCAVIVPHGFDVRLLMERWGDVCENKRDAMLFAEGKAKD